MDEFHTLRAKLAVITSFRAIVGARPAAPITISKQASCNKAVSKGLRQGALHSSAICCFSATDKLSKLWTLLQAPGEAERMKHTRSLQTNGAIQRSSIRCWGNALAVASQHPSCDIDPTANPPKRKQALLARTLPSGHLASHLRSHSPSFSTSEPASLFRGRNAHPQMESRGEA